MKFTKFMTKIDKRKSKRLKTMNNSLKDKVNETLSK